jgi:hypothetical protein
MKRPISVTNDCSGPGRWFDERAGTFVAHTCRFGVSKGQLVKKRYRHRVEHCRIGLRRRQGRAVEGE